MTQGTFQDTLRAFVGRASRPVGQVAQSLGVQRGTVYKWLDGSSLPKVSNIAKMKAALAWTDENGVAHQLTDQEVEILLVEAGRSLILPGKAIDFDSPGSHASETVVYTYRFSPDAVPTNWVLRLSEAERDIPGSLIGVSSMLPTLFRPFEIQRQRVESLVSEHRLAAIKEVWEARFDNLQKRMRNSTVRYIVNHHNLAAYASLEDPWTSGQLTPKAVHDHGRRIIQWLKDYDNFQLVLAEHHPQCDFSVLGSRLLFIEFPQHNYYPVYLLKGTYVMGMEIKNPASIGCFIEQAESILADDSTLTDKEQVIDELSRLFGIGKFS